MTINDHWGWSRDDRNTKSVRRLVHVLARSASVGGNFLLNVGPTPEGEIPALHQERLRAVGRWLVENGASIYATRAGIIPPTRESVSTQRGDRHFVHVLDDVSDCVILAGVPADVQRARLLASGRELVLEREGANFFVSAASDRTTIYIPPERRDPFDTVIELF
jgi:alpha-L-fucosidase